MTRPARTTAPGPGPGPGRLRIPGDQAAHGAALHVTGLTCLGRIPGTGEASLAAGDLAEPVDLATCAPVRSGVVDAPMGPPPAGTMGG